MFERIKRGWEITKESFRIIKKDKEILVFPILEIILLLFLTFVFVVILFVGGIGASIINKDFGNIFIYIWFLIYLFFTYFVGIFFEAAIISSASIRLSRKNPSIGDGLSLPSKKLGKLFIWAFISMIVGIILNFLSKLGRRRGKGAEIASSVGAGILGFTWGLITFLVIPVLLFEKLGIFSSIGRSWGLFKQTWGENITAQFSIGGIFFLFGIVGAIPLAISIYLGISVLIFIMVILFLLYIGVLIVFATSVKGILVAVLYRYAVKHKDAHVYGLDIKRGMFA